jgi:hypothetical protein
MLRVVIEMRVKKANTNRQRARSTATMRSEALDKDIIMLGIVRL